jgi:hypothetical protein
VSLTHPGLVHGGGGKMETQEPPLVLLCLLHEPYSLHVYRQCACLVNVQWSIGKNKKYILSRPASEAVWLSR